MKSGRKVTTFFSHVQIIFSFCYANSTICRFWGHFLLWTWYNKGGASLFPFGAKFLRNLARYMVNRVFKNNLSRSVLPTEWKNARSMVGMTLPAIPTVQSKKSLGFSMPMRERYRPFVLIVEDLGNGGAEHRTQQADVGKADYPHSMRVQ